MEEGLRALEKIVNGMGEIGRWGEDYLRYLELMIRRKEPGKVRAIRRAFRIWLNTEDYRAVYAAMLIANFKAAEYLPDLEKKLSAVQCYIMEHKVSYLYPSQIQAVIKELREPPREETLDEMFAKLERWYNKEWLNKYFASMLDDLELMVRRIDHKNANMIAATLRQWLISGNDLKIRYAIGLIGRLHLQELRPELERIAGEDQDGMMPVIDPEVKEFAREMKVVLDEGGEVETGIQRWQRETKTQTQS